MNISSKIALYFCIFQFFTLIPSDNVQITTLYCPGVCGDSNQMYEYKDQIQGPCQPVHFPDAQIPKGLFDKIVHFACKKALHKQNINRAEMYFGQGQDIQAIKNQINSDKTYILYGLCRGGMAIINYMAQYNPTNIAALVLDETIADVLDIVEKLMYPKKDNKVTSTPIQRENMLRTIFPSYPKGKKPPVQNIAAIKNKDVPIFLVYANKDTTFHFPSSTWRNYIAFKKAGFKHVYLCELKETSQGAQGKDKIKYLQSLHSFYKKYNLAYDPQFAVLTEAELQEFQPSIQDIQAKLKNSQNMAKTA
ncbi:MAG: hypothetical protein Q8Q60_00410 [Candidatus Chromulinivorax sp.]|nr:hypothetical protein [Candidatus Chromulinivorax sp.]